MQTGQRVQAYEMIAWDEEFGEVVWWRRDPDFGGGRLTHGTVLVPGLEPLVVFDDDDRVVRVEFKQMEFPQEDLRRRWLEEMDRKREEFKENVNSMDWFRDAYGGFADWLRYTEWDYEQGIFYQLSDVVDPVSRWSAPGVRAVKTGRWYFMVFCEARSLGRHKFTQIRHRTNMRLENREQRDELIAGLFGISQ